jgi:hypothetical protein
MAATARATFALHGLHSDALGRLDLCRSTKAHESSERPAASKSSL